jgi:hypothetical protein
MTETELKKLRSYYHSLLEQQRILDGAAATRQPITRRQVGVLADELQHLEADFPELVPRFRRDAFLQRPASSFTQHGHTTHFEELYDNEALRSYLGRAISRLKIASETTESTPVTETREFSFVGNAKLRRILERDYRELQRAYIADCWKSVIILAGGAIEAMLTDLLLQHQTKACSATKAPKKPDITRWDLIDLINVSVELALVSAGIERLSHSVRDYRNLVHPGNEIRSGLMFEAEEAKIAIEVLHILHRDLSY